MGIVVQNPPQIVCEEMFGSRKRARPNLPSLAIGLRRYFGQKGMDVI